MVELPVPRRYKWIRDEIHRLDPRRDCEQIVSLLYDWRFSDPKGVHLLVTLGFVRQVAVPAIASVIDRDGEGKLIRAAARRGADTLRFFGEWFKHGPTSTAGRASIERLNAIHARFPIQSDQSLYTLASMVVYSDHLFRLVGAPGLDAHEKDALAEFWRRVAEAMRLDHVPEDYGAFDRYYDVYERENFAPSEGGTRAANALIGDFAARWFPPALAGFARAFAIAHFDERLDQVFASLRRPGRAATAAIRLMNRAQIALVDRILPDRRTPRYVLDSFTT